MPVFLMRTQGISSALQAPDKYHRLNDKPIPRFTFAIALPRFLEIRNWRWVCIPQMAKTELANLSLLLSLLLCGKENNRIQFDFL